MGTDLGSMKECEAIMVLPYVVKHVLLCILIPYLCICAWTTKTTTKNQHYNLNKYMYVENVYTRNHFYWIKTQKYTEIEKRNSLLIRLIITFCSRKRENWCKIYAFLMFIRTWKKKYLFLAWWRDNWLSSMFFYCLFL